jgi:hypothetical protein
MSLAYLSAWALPILAGICIYLVFDRVRGAGWGSAAAGYGIAFGLLLVSALTSLSARADSVHAWTKASPWLVLVLLAAAALAWRWERKTSTPAPSAAPEKIARWKWIVLPVLLASLLLRALIAFREVWLRPTYPWDAWSAWAVKAKTWFLLGHYVPFASMQDWILKPDADLYTGVAWRYPDALAWMQVWFASAAGDWIEPLVNLPWLALWIALLFGHYGQWRALGMCRTRALFFVYLLGSLPLLLVHAAIAGYADIWVAALFGFGVLAWMRWLQRREVGQLLLALICAAVLPTLKLEGLVWAVCLLAAIAFGALPSRWRGRCLIFASVAFLALCILGGLHSLLGLTGWAGAKGASGSSSLAFSWHGDAALGIARTLFAQPNWHLLWWIVTPLIVWRWRELIAREWLWLPGLLLQVCVALLLFLFLFTDAGHWAQNFTAINRLVLQITPALVTLLAMLLRDARLPQAPSDTAPGSDRRSDPG